MLKNFQFQKDAEAILHDDLKRIITHVKFVPCFMRCVLVFERKDSLKPTSHSTIFDIPMRPVRKDQIHQRRFTR